jgi:hypothetical protein
MAKEQPTPEAADAQKDLMPVGNIMNQSIT